jgi:UDP-N-acetylmuramate--alanine ligase
MKNDVYQHKSIHFVGIGGIGMSALAQHFAMRGHTVRGSDLVDNSVTHMLREKGIEVFIGHSAHNVKDATLCVRSSAVKDDNPEISECVQRSIEVINREELLGIVFNSHKVKIAVSGSHGKTTTCGMLASAMIKGGHNPTVFIGGLTKKGNYIPGGDICIAEACEYKASFLTLTPDIAVILNVDMDHVDYYKDLLEVEKSFSKFAACVDEKGFVVYNGDQLPEYILKGVAATAISYGFDKRNHYRAVNLRHSKGLYSFDVYKLGIYYTSATLRVRGMHNIYNALATLVVCDILNTDTKLTIEAINEFEGVERRWTQIENDFTNIVEDYAHHPSEIRALIKTALQQGYNKVFAVFQPHTYTRTQAMFSDFVTCFEGVDELFLLPVYAAREEPISGVSSKELARVIDDIGKIQVRHLESFEECAAKIKQCATKDDLVLIVGAGDINTLSSILSTK